MHTWYVWHVNIEHICFLSLRLGWSYAGGIGEGVIPLFPLANRRGIWQIETWWPESCCGSCDIIAEKPLGALSGLLRNLWRALEAVLSLTINWMSDNREGLRVNTSGNTWRLFSVVQFWHRLVPRSGSASVWRFKPGFGMGIYSDDWLCFPFLSIWMF